MDQENFNQLTKPIKVALAILCTTWFNKKEPCILPTECVYGFFMTLTVTNLLSLNSINL
jgi:hypothetical protein